MVIPEPLPAFIITVAVVGVNFDMYIYAAKNGENGAIKFNELYTAGALFSAR